MEFPQYGQGLHGFQGTRIQSGRGLGSVFGGLFRRALPMLKSTARQGVQEVIRSGMDIFKDVSQGKNLKQALRQRGKEATKRVINNVGKSLSQAGAGRKRIKRKANSKSVISRPTKVRKTTPQKQDIFGIY